MSRFPVSPCARAAAMALVLVSSSSSAQAPPPPDARAPGLPHVVEQGVSSSTRISLEVGQDRLLELSFPLRSMSIPNPDVADVKLLSSNLQVLLSAKGVGDTYITLFDKTQQPLVLSVHVTRNLEALRKQLKELFPEEQVSISAAGDLVILSGDVSDLRVPQRMAEVAKLHSPKLANLLHVRGNQQVQLEVKFAEVSRAGLRQMGVNWFHDAPGQRVAGVVSPGTPPGNFLINPPQNGIPDTSIPGVPAVHQPSFGSAFSLFFAGLGQFPFSVMVSLLEQNQLAKTLAEPTLVAMTGQEASFLAGGEFPIPMASGLGQVSVLFKKFGIQLKFLPTVLADGVINLHLETEVSEIDQSLGVSIGGYTVPGLTQRQSATTVRMRDGQSFAIAGLLSDKVRSTIGKIPLLGEIPILGALFRSTSYRRDETELLVVITARLARPVAAHDAPFLPGEEELNDPDDFELFLMGRTGRKPTLDAVRGQAIPVEGDRSGGPSGDLGYMR
ncbi:MAG: type II and III secretion system protein family protein [Myxococcales bacterium]|nr:type II and III secretion system protein family protein [Myxococcales bacterium]